MPYPLKNPNWQQDLKEELNNGVSFQKACVNANVNYKTALRHGYSTTQKRITRSQVDKIIELREQGYKLREIADLTGLKKSAIYCNLQKCGIKKGAKIAKK